MPASIYRTYKLQQETARMHPDPAARDVASTAAKSREVVTMDIPGDLVLCAFKQEVRPGGEAWITGYIPNPQSPLEITDVYDVAKMIQATPFFGTPGTL
jgi:hypothetical protein